MSEMYLSVCEEGDELSVYVTREVSYLCRNVRREVSCRCCLCEESNERWRYSLSVCEE